MNEALLYEEVQGIRSKGAAGFFRVIAVLFLLALAFNLLRQKGAVGELTYGLLTGAVLSALLSIFSDYGMITQIRTDGIYVRLKPFKPTFSIYRWTEIARVYLREYHPMEFSGWGIRRGPNGLGYVIPGNTGIQIELTNGAKVLITTHQPDEVTEVLRTLG